MLSQRPQVVGLAEVTGVFEDMRGLRKWFRGKGYLIQFLVGEKAPCREERVQEVEGREAKGNNSVVVAYRRDAVTCMSFERLATRVLAVELWSKAEKRARRVVVMHGLHEEIRAVDEDRGVVPAWSFRTQLREARGWLGARGGLLLGDLNRVPCKRWRMGESVRELDVADRELREVVGWSCSCCTPAGLGSRLGVQLVGGDEQSWEPPEATRRRVT